MPEGGWARSRTHPQGGEGFGAEVGCERAGGEGPDQGRLRHRRGDQGGRGVHGAARGHHLSSQITFLRRSTAASCQASSWPTSRTGGRAPDREDQLALAELPEFTANPDSIRGPRRAISILDDIEYLERGFQEARRRQGGDACRSRTARSRRVRRDPGAGGPARHVDVHPVGARNLEQGARTAPSSSLRRPADRSVRPGAPNFKRSILHRQVIGRTTWSTSTTCSRQHLPRRADRGSAVPHASRRRLRRLPGRRSAASTRPRRPPTAGGGVNDLPPITPCARCARTACAELRASGAPRGGALPAPGQRPLAVDEPDRHAVGVAGGVESWKAPPIDRVAVADGWS